MADNLLSIVRPSAWQALLRRMDAAVARDDRLGAARDAVLRPVDLLRAMAVDAHGALADDVLRADRLRALLFVAWPYVAVALEAKKLLVAKAPPASADTSVLAAVVKASTSHELGWPVMQAYEPGVIDHAGLVVLALAAARVADPPYAPVFVASIHGLALAASAAEVLGRLDPRQPDAEPLEVVLAALYAISAAGAMTRNEFLRPFSLDPVERGRWSCLAEILEGPLFEAAIRLGRGWDGATSDEILEVAPKSAAAKHTVTLRVRGGDPLSDATVVFASPGGVLCPATASAGTTKKDVTPVSVVVPATASPGWIGFSRKKLIAASNEARAALREELASVLAMPCVDGLGRIEPSVSLPDYGALATPRRRGLNRFEGGVPLVLFADTRPPRVRAGQMFELRWETAGADAVEIHFGDIAIDDAEPTGVRALPAPATDGEVVIEIRARATRGTTVVRSEPYEQTVIVDLPVQIANVEVTQGGIASPLFAQRALDVAVQLTMPAIAAQAQLVVADHTVDAAAIEPGRVTFEVPAELVVDGMKMHVTVADREGVRAATDVGPLAMRAQITAEIVLVRPAIVAAARIDDPIALDAAHETVIRAAAAAGVTATVIDLPWADDELAALAARPGSDADPLLVRVLEALSRRALLTPRFEHAVWLALLPDPSDARAAAKLPRTMLAASTPLGSIARAVPANAARAVAVATPRGLARLFGQLFTAAPPTPTIAVGPRLAIVGSLGDHAITIEDMRVDERGAGVGAPIATTFEIATFDAGGRELAVLPIRVLAATKPAALAMLVPVSPAVASLELRSQDGVIHKVLRRAPGELTIGIHKPSSKAFEWSWNHTGNARPTASVLLRRDGLETPVLEIDPCQTHVDLPIWRYAGADEIRLYATDGWNADEKPGTEDFSNDAIVVLRRLSDGRFFADAPDGWSLTWVVDGTTKKRDTRTYKLAADDKGMLELVAKRGSATIREAVPLDR